jgi:hypothetical protein
MSVWRIIKPEFFKAALAGLSDYFSGHFGEGRGVSEFLKDESFAMER